MDIFSIVFAMEDDWFNTRGELHGDVGSVKSVKGGDKEARIEASDTIFGDLSLDFGIVFAKLVGNRADGEGVGGFGFTND